MNKPYLSILLMSLASLACAQGTSDGSPATAAAPAQALTAEDANAWLDGYLPYALRTGDIAGAVVAIVKDGQVVTERGYGFSDVEKRTPVDPKRTLFRPGSVSKLLTWTAVMQQVEAGKIDLDADVNRYLDFNIPARDGKPVTMRNLMQHSAGFEEQAKGVITYDPNGSRFEALLKQWVPDRVFAPGTTPAYSNYGASLAGYIVQRVSGESFDDYIDKHIFEPLEMHFSSFRQPLPAQLAPFMSKGYRTASQPATPFEIVGPAPAGSLSSSGEDMAHFMIAHLQSGEYQGKRILGVATAQQMHDSPANVSAPLNRMELGFFETNINGREVIAHLGDTEDFHTSLHLFLKENVGFYVSFNSAGKGGASGNLRGAMFQDFADRYLPGTREAPGVDQKTAALHAAMLSGSWENSRGSRTTFLSVVDLIGQTRVGLDATGGLLVPFPGLNGQPRHWVEVSPFLWLDLNSHERLGAKVVDGQAVRFSIDELSPFMVFQRAPWYRNTSWLRPLFIMSIAALALTLLFWPIGALTRRSFGAPLALNPQALAAYRCGKLGATLIVCAIVFWAILLGLMVTNNTYLSGSADGLLRLVQLFGIVAFIGGLVLILINARAVWTGQRRWPARLWSVVTVLSAVIVLWTAFVFNLLKVGAHY
jgi:CubicO group peptidase (beta-lactamase class C family)